MNIPYLWILHTKKEEAWFEFDKACSILYDENQHGD